MKIEIDKQLLRNVTKACIGFSEHDIGEVCIEFMRGGLLITAADKKSISIIAITISKKLMKAYEIEDTNRLIIADYTAKEITDFCMMSIKNDEDRNKRVVRKNRYLKKQAKENDTQATLIDAPELEDNITLNFDTNKLNMNVGPLEKSITTFTDQLPTGDITGRMNSLTRMYDNLDKIGEMNEEQFTELLNYMRATYSFENKERRDNDRVIKIIKNEERFEIESEIETGDDVIMNLGKILTKKTEESLNILLMSKTLYKGLNCISKLSTSIVLTGKTDNPVIVSATGESPEDAGKFKEPINFWYVIAPRIESE